MIDLDLVSNGDVWDRWRVRWWAAAGTGKNECLPARAFACSVVLGNDA